MRLIGKIALASVSMLSLAAPAYAEDNTTEKKDDAPIVVTGTLIRGTEVSGSQTIAVDTTAIAAQGAVTTNQMLGLIPQIANAFNGRFENDPRGAKTITITRPNLRNMPGLNDMTGAVTLVMVDGKRITPVGIKESAVDPDVIPAMALEGVDVVTDGGSSLYGADAIAGVINFRTRRKYEGLKVDGNFGFGTTLKHYSQWDASILAGKSWSTGNFWITAGASHRDFVSAGETSWADGVRYKTDGSTTFTGTQCITPVGTQTVWGFVGSTWTTNVLANPRFPAGTSLGRNAVGTSCDITSATTYSPKQDRYNVYGALTQEFSDNISLRVTGYWTKRKTQLFDYPLGMTSAASPFSLLSGETGAKTGGEFATYYNTVLNPGGPAPTLFVTTATIPGGIGFSFGANSAYVNRPNENGFETWGITPELTAKLGGDWQLTTSVHIGRSTNYQRFPEVNKVLAQCYISGCTGIAAGQLDPQHADRASASVIGSILDYETAQDTIQQMFNFRAVADGSLFELPGGAAKLAVGVEYNNPSAKVRLGTQPRGGINSLSYMRAERNAKSVFGELLLPVAPFADISGSIRYDNYSDFGSTTNPSIGLTLKPMDGLKIFGHWNTSFNAPTTLDTLPLSLGRTGSITYCPTSSCNHPDPNAPTGSLGRWDGQGSVSLVLEGPGFGIKPQTAHSWAVGFEAKPLSGLRFGGEFYSIDFRNVIGSVNTQSNQSFIDFPDKFIISGDVTGGKTIAQWYADLVSGLANAEFIKANVPASSVAIIVDRRTSNLFSEKLEGVDFHINYDTNVSFGQLSLGLSGTKTFKAMRSTGAIQSDDLGLNGPEFTATSYVGLKSGGFNGRVTVNYSGRFHDGVADYLGNTAYVAPFVVANLFLGYDFAKDAGALSGTSLRLSVDNVLNEKPTYIKRSPSSSGLSYGGWTLGRVIRLGFSKEF